MMNNIWTSNWKSKWKLDNELPLNISKEIPTMTIAAGSIFLENEKYYPQVFLDECLYKLWVI